MRVALDLRCLRTPHHGIARYAQGLLAHLPLGVGDTLYALLPPGYAQPLPPQVEPVNCTAAPLSLAEQWEIPRLLRRLSPDLYHSPSFMRPLQLPVPWSLTLHDLIHVQFAADYGVKQRWYYRWLRQQLPQARGLLTVSQTSATYLRAWIRAAHPPLRMAWPGVEAHFHPAVPRPDLPLPPAYLLFVGNPKPHKGLAVLKKALTALPDAPPLVTVGVPPEPGLHALQNVSETELAGLYAHATIVVLPSLAEGFGLPLLEAMACGAPVLASDLPVLREVGETAARYVLPADRAAWQRAIQELWANPAEQTALRQAGPKRAAAFTWQNMATTTWEAWHDWL